jgi:hypothetical protein
MRLVIDFHVGVWLIEFEVEDRRKGRCTMPVCWHKASEARNHSKVVERLKLDDGWGGIGSGCKADSRLDSKDAECKKAPQR